MKTIFIALAIIASASAYPQTPVQNVQDLFYKIGEQDEPAGCEFCRKGVSVMFKNLGMDSDVLDMEMQALGKVCDTLPDPKGCMKGVSSWWPKIAATLFNDRTAEATCLGLSEGKCKPHDKFFDSWNCQTCQADVKAVAKLWSNSEALKRITSLMADGLFCKRSDLGLKPDQVAACQKYMMAFLSPGMKVVMSELDTQSSKACNAWFNVC